MRRDIVSEVTLEKIDIIRSRTKLSYSEAKELLEKCNGDVVEALVYYEKMKENNQKSFVDDVSMSVDEFVSYIKELVKKGNVTRIKIKKEEKVLVDIPINAAGIALGIVAFLQPLLLILGAATAIITKLQIEITKADGTVEVVNKIIKSVFDETKEKVNETAEEIKDKFTGKDSSNNYNPNDHVTKNDDNYNENEINTFSYTVKFEDDENPKES